ncbi:MAG TPA: histidine--tRNA ligase [Sedimentisphaerales bacterium]|nr:histidine--tRNA ligase [Sedimentisphaerales bacterium]
MKIPPVKGTRDFYPPDMAIRNFIVDGWKKVSLRNGFEEYDGPIFEYLKMYQIKSGDEIVEQLFSLTDRGGRDLALRPEITPTLARMVNQQINALPKPIKWFSVPRLLRAERPQKGRLREFFQWNIDIIGIDQPLADAEIIFTTVYYLRDLGLTPKDVKARISSRKLLAAVLKSYGVPDEKLEFLYVVLDKKAKLPSETFEQMLAEQVPDKDSLAKILAFMKIGSIQELGALIDAGSEEFEAYKEIKKLLYTLETMGVGDFCVYDPSIVRGLAYYTGIVFEVHDAVGDLRAICGGGRYDNLLRDFGGPSIPATGMGMGDCVLEILLREKGLLDKQVPKRHLEYFVISLGLDEQADEEVYRIIARLRSMGHSANFSYKTGGLSKQLKEASAQNAKKCIIIGNEFKDKKLVIKDMVTGEQKFEYYNEFLAGLDSA